LEAAGLVTVTAGEQDRRVRVARLTGAGRAERNILDERADDLASGLLAPLNDRQRTQLVGAMREVDRLLTAGLVTVVPTDPDHPHARHCLSAYFDELDRRFDGGFDAQNGISADGDELRLPAGLLLVATLHGEPVGCGALRFEQDHAQIKRMWVADGVRGLGIGRRLLAELEQQARVLRKTTVRLETNKALTEAVTMYRAHGYREVDPFNDEYYAHHWFEKAL
jgi:GNAT superfamily N-acetyltransferase